MPNSHDEINFCGAVIKSSVLSLSHSIKVRLLYVGLGLRWGFFLLLANPLAPSTPTSI